MFKLAEKAGIDHLNGMMEWVLEKSSEYVTLSKKQSNEIQIVCEEVLANIILYAYPKTDEPGDVMLELEFEEETGMLIICFIDSGIAFNPLEKDKPDLTADIMERPIGGLGIFIIRKIADSVQYERLEDQNRLTVQIKYRAGEEKEVK